VGGLTCIGSVEPIKVGGWIELFWVNISHQQSRLSKLPDPEAKK
jgi:hypothetical protein